MLTKTTYSFMDSENLKITVQLLQYHDSVHVAQRSEFQVLMRKVDIGQIYSVMHSSISVAHKTSKYNTCLCLNLLQYRTLQGLTIEVFHTSEVLYNLTFLVEAKILATRTLNLLRLCPAL